MNIQRLRVNHIVNPLGFDLGAPTFSWEVAEALGTRAEASRIVITSAGKELVDTGWADLDNACAIIEGLAELLAPRTRYEWRVSVRTDAGEEATSEAAWFETGKMGEPWEAAWITCDSSEPRHPVFSSDLPLSEGKEVVEARLYLCGLGLYDVYLGGVHVGQEYLASGTHAYDKWLQVATHDVTDLLRKSTHLEVRMGNGWWKAALASSPWTRASTATTGASLQRFACAT